MPQCPGKHNAFHSLNTHEQSQGFSHDMRAIIALKKNMMKDGLTQSTLSSALVKEAVSSVSPQLDCSSCFNPADDGIFRKEPGSYLKSSFIAGLLNRAQGRETQT